MSGSTIGSVLGAGVGFLVAGPAGARWGWMIGGAIGGYVDPDVIKGPKLENAQPQLSNEGAPRPLIYGRAAVTGNIIQVGPLVEHKKRERTGKGGGPVQETYTYTRTVAIRICEAAPLGGEMKLVRVWANDKLIYSRVGGLVADTANFASGLTFYSGSEDQLPDPSLEALPAAYGGGVGNVPAYRGTCYAVLTDLDCTDYRGAVPQFKWEVASCGTLTNNEESRPYTWMIQSSTERKFFVSGVGAETWTDSVAHGLTFNYPTAVTGGVIYGQAAYKSSDYETFSSLGGPALTGPVYRLDSGRLIGWSSSDVVYSDNEWGTYTTVAAGFTIGWMAVGGNTVIIGNTGTSRRISNDSGASFGSVLTASYSLTSGGYSDGLWVFGGAFDNMAWSNDDGVTLNYSTATGIGQSIQVLPAGGGAWLSIRRTNSTATTNVIFRSADGKTGWASLTTPSCKFEGSETNRVAQADGVVIAAAQDSSGYLKILRSADNGQTFTEIAHPYGNVEAIGVAAFETGVYAGIEIPDVPGYYYDRSTGEVNGPSVGTLTPCTITLDEVVGDLTERGGATNYDVSALASDVVIGYPILQPTNAAGAIKALQQVYFFDYPEWGESGETTTTFHAVKRGGATVWSLTDDDLVDFEDSQTRAQPLEFPRKVNLVSLSPDENYNPIKQTAERESENVRAIGESTVDTAVVFDRDGAARTADITLKVMWEEANGRAQVQVPEEFTRYVPSDCGTFDGKRWRIDRVALEDGVSTWDLTRDRASAYSSSVGGSTTLDPEAAASSLRGPTMFAAMNLPRLRSQDATPGMYIAVCGLMPGWVGADLYLSTDGGLSEQLVATIIDPATMGVLTASITATGEPLSVDLYDGEVSSATTAQLDARLNAAAVTSAGVSEILQFADADQVDNLADLTTLRRGQLNTTAAAHTVDDSFVLLDGSIYFLPLDIALAGRELIFRPVSRGTVTTNNPTYTVTFSPLFTGPQVVEPITVSGEAITVSGETLWRINTDA